MKPQVEEVEDDLAAEEENKLINEVCLQNVCLKNRALLTLFCRNTKSGEDQKVYLCIRPGSLHRIGRKMRHTYTTS